MMNWVMTTRQNFKIAFNAGQEIPNIINVSQVATFGLIGGSGSTICLLIATFIIGRSLVTKMLQNWQLLRVSLISMNQ